MNINVYKQDQAIRQRNGAVGGGQRLDESRNEYNTRVMLDILNLQNSMINELRNDIKEIREIIRWGLK